MERTPIREMSPARAGGREVAGDAGSSATPATGRVPRVLVVDDLPEFRETLADMLAHEGYAVTTAIDGQDATEKALADPPDLILMDATMPRMTGFEACRRLKLDTRTRLVPIVIVTALAARRDRIDGIAAGCDDFLTKPVDKEELLARTRTALRLKLLTDQLEEAENVLVSLANAIEAKDSYTRGHSERVAHLAVALGGLRGLGEEERRHLYRAGLIHDIGKIGIPLTYLHKPGRLTSEEFEQVKRHPVVGYEICLPLRTLAAVLPLVRGHHERLDGSGYPDGLRGDEIPLSLRCLSVADVYDALTSARSYRSSLGHERACAILEEESRAGYWDASVVALVADAVRQSGAAGA